MRAVVSTAPGVIEVNWQWLPSFIGMNRVLQDKIVERVKPQLIERGLVIDERTLDVAHDLVIDVVVEEFGASIEGLRDYLDGLKFVRYVSDGEGKPAV